MLQAAICVSAVSTKTSATSGYMCFSFVTEDECYKRLYVFQLCHRRRVLQAVTCVSAVSPKTSSTNGYMCFSCVTEDECYKRWWQETSDQTLCLSIMSLGNGPTGAAVNCNYCCYGDKCNSPDFPASNTLYDGNNRGQYPVG